MDMARRGMLACLLAAAVLAAPAGLAGTASESGVVARVVDGDTIALADGRRLRLLQVDAPEPGTGECYSRVSGRELRRLAPEGAHVRLEADPRLDRVDRYGRLLRYVFAGTVNVNLELVRRGAATVWLYEGERGRYADALLAAAQGARADRRGLWGACRTVWNPYGPATTSAARSGAPAAGGCDPSYSGACVPRFPPDLDCDDIRARGLAPVRVVGDDPHRLDRDGDGFGCE